MTVNPAGHHSHSPGGPPPGPAGAVDTEADAAVSRLLNEIPARPAAAGELLPLVYDQLRVIAAQRMREERAGHTLQATALVHEAYVRLARPGETAGAARFEGSAHFFRAAAEAMRKILIDHARRRDADKRGGGRKAGPLSAAIDVAASPDGADPEAALILNEALTTLEAEDPRSAEVVKLRFFTGLGFAEVAQVLGLSERTVLREWAFARARLVELIEPEQGRSEE